MNQVIFVSMIIFAFFSYTEASRKNDKIIKAAENRFLRPWIGCMHGNRINDVDSNHYYSSFELIPEPIKSNIENELSSNLGENWNEETQLVEAGLYLIGKNNLSTERLTFWFTYNVIDTLYLTEGRSNLDGSEFVLSYEEIRKSIKEPTYSLSRSWEILKELDVIPRFCRVSGEVQNRYIPRFDKRAWVIPMRRALPFSYSIKRYLLFDIETGEFLGAFTPEEYYPLKQTEEQWKKTQQRDIESLTVEEN